MDSGSKIVSSESEELILVDTQDIATGHLPKAECHDGDGVLHRAFSLFLFNGRRELLLQRRSASKRLWPGYWSNSCCSHPRRGESIRAATQRRLQDELNVTATLEFVYKFHYQASFGEAGSENELCHVFVGTTGDVLRPNVSEIAEVRFVTASGLSAELEAGADAFTPWFEMEWRELNQKFPDVLARYC
ncbi:MAG: isopentenyl-diphosphate Delta-isomerase [Woeseiaceae bacterium]